MKKQITKIITKAVLYSFLTGTVISLLTMFIIDIQTSNYYDDGRPRMSCFAGLGYGIAAGVHVLFLILSLPAFLNLLKTVRDNKLLSSLSFFGCHIIYIVFILANYNEFSGEEFLLLIPFASLIVLAFYYFKLRKSLY